MRKVKERIYVFDIPNGIPAGTYHVQGWGVENASCVFMRAHTNPHMATQVELIKRFESGRPIIDFTNTDVNQLGLNFNGEVNENGND